MSAPTLTAASWIAFLAGSTAAERAAAWAAFGVDTIEFRDASDATIRTITCGAWTVGSPQGGYYPVAPGVYTDSGVGAGTPVAAVFKAGATEKWRCSCGTAVGNFYRLRANIAAGVKIARGNFAVLVGPPPSAGTSQPVNTSAPAISGTPTVGSTLNCLPGSWTGNPVPSVSRQWYRGSTPIAGATGLAYTLTSADVGSLVTCIETATNSVATIQATSNAVGPVTAGGFAFSVPSQINISQGGTYPLAQHVSGGTPPYQSYTVASGSLPAGVTLNADSGVLSAAIGATVGESGDLRFNVLDSAVAAALPLFGVISAVGGSNLPFAFGHAFDQGDIPAGSYLNSDLADWQAVPTTYWPDGSLRHAIIAGLATCSAGAVKGIALSVAATNRTGTALTESDLAAALPSVTLQAGSDSFTLNSLVGTAARHRTVCTGPVMSNWLYRRQIAGSNHLVAWFDVRLYKGGNVEIFPWAENSYLTVANPINDVRTWTLTIAGVQRFSQSIDIKHHTRVPLLSGSTFAYWTGTDPQITPKHDVAYLRSTKMVPNYGWTSPSATKLNGLQQTYSPNTLAGISTAMGAAGGSAYILNNADALYAACGDARAWRASVVFALSGGSWSIHRRAEASSTQGAAGFPNEPFMFSQYPNASIQVQDSPTIPEGSGGENGTPVISHQPSYGYLQWLCSGRWWFLEEMLFWGGWNYLYNTVANRQGAGSSGANGVIKTGAGANTDRGAAWGLRTLAQGLVSLPTTHPCYASLKTSWEANTAWYKALTIDGTVNAGADVNALGIMGFYGSFAQSVYSAANASTEMYGAGWMQAMVQQVLGFTWDLALPQDAASQSRHQAIRDLGYTAVVARAGDGSGNSWRYRNFIVYGLNWGTIGGTYYGSWDGAYAKYKAGFGITNDGDGGTSLFSHSSQTDLAPGSSSKPYFGQALTALAYAVDHGKAGASAGWARVSGASNFAGYTAAEFNDEPEHGVVPRSAVSSAVYGLEWDGTGAMVRRLEWNAPPPIYGSVDGMTYIFKVYPRKKTVPPFPNGYFTTFFWGNNGTFFWNGGNAGTYYGAHPYPIPAPNGPGQWEISVDGGDFVTGTEVQWDRWYTQAFRAWRVSATETRHEFYYDLPDTSKVITWTVNDAAWAATNPPSPAIVMGQAPNVGSASWGGYAGYEEFNGRIRGIQIYDGLLSLADIAQEVATPKSSVKGAASIWYLNTDPRPSDVSDKSGAGHHPSWAGSQASEWVGP